MRPGPHLFLAFVLAVCASAFPPRSLCATEVTLVPVAENIYRFEGTMANCVAFVGPDGVLIADSGEGAELGEAMMSALRTVSDKPIEYLVNTHHHFDHVSGNAVFGRAGAKIIAQENLRDICTSQARWPEVALPPEGMPSICFKDSLTLHLNGEEVLIFHPETGGAHTDNDAVLFFRHANVLYTGDLLCNGMYPYIDASHRGWAQGMAESCRMVLALIDENTIVIPGHGKVCDRRALEQNVAMLADVGGKVAAMMKEGLSQEQIRQAKPSAAWDAEFSRDYIKAFGKGTSPDEFVDMVYNALKARDTE